MHLVSSTERRGGEGVLRGGAGGKELQTHSDHRPTPSPLHAEARQAGRKLARFYSITAADLLDLSLHQQ